MESEHGAAFDGVAAVYDRDFTDTAIGRLQRDLVWELLDGWFRAGDRVLELGCGTGEDAVWMAERGIKVLATDASDSMLEQAEAKAGAAGVAERVRSQRLDLAKIADEARPAGAPFDGVLSNFGALNCLADRRPLARRLADWVRPGGRVVVVVMGRVCMWEILWFTLRMRPRKAFRRFAQGRNAGVGGGHTVPVWYPGPGRLTKDFSPYFKAVHTRAIGALVPSPDLAPLFDKRPGLLARLARIERPLAPALAWMADHYLVCLERCHDA